MRKSTRTAAAWLGIVAGIAGFAAKLWPWSLVVFVGWTLGQFPFGHFFNDFLQSIMYISLLVILTSLSLTIFTARASDAVQ